MTRLLTVGGQILRVLFMAHNTVRGDRHHALSTSFHSPFAQYGQVRKTWSTVSCTWHEQQSAFPAAFLRPMRNPLFTILYRTSAYVSGRALCLILRYTLRSPSL